MQVCKTSKLTEFLPEGCGTAEFLPEGCVGRATILSLEVLAQAGILEHVLDLTQELRAPDSHRNIFSGILSFSTRDVI